MKVVKVVKSMSYDWQNSNGLDSEKYVILTPGALHEIAQWEEWDNVSKSDIELFVKVTYKGTREPIYRKAIAVPFKDFKKDDVMIAYRTRKQLKVDDGYKVTIQKTCWFTYLWFNMDSAIRWPFRIAIFMGAGTIIQWVIAICELICYMV